MAKNEANTVYRCLLKIKAPCLANTVVTVLSPPLRNCIRK